jgi:hypothetical protein
MSAERVYVGAVINGQEQFYQRDSEQKGKDGKWYAVPYFVLNRSEGSTMSEAAAKMFVARLRSLKVSTAWIEDAKDGRRIEFATETVQQSGADTRTSLRATLDDEQMIESKTARWYKVHPIDRPDGAGQWFIRCTPPGFPNAQIIRGKDPVSCLQRAADINLLQYAEPAPPPEPDKPVTPKPIRRRRPGDL